MLALQLVFRVLAFIEQYKEKLRDGGGAHVLLNILLKCCLCLRLNFSSRNCSLLAQILMCTTLYNICCKTVWMLLLHKIVWLVKQANKMLIQKAMLLVHTCNTCIGIELCHKQQNDKITNLHNYVKFKNLNIQHIGQIFK